MKKVISILVSLVMLLGAFAITASAAGEVTPAGFYNIGTNGNLVIDALSSSGAAVTQVAVDVDGDGNDDTLYANSDVLKVVYSQAVEGAYYGLILVEGTGLPTVDNVIYYIDQVTAEDTSIEFEVFPKLPETRTDLTLYVSSSVEGSELQSVTLYYTPEVISDGGDEPELIEITEADFTFDLTDKEYTGSAITPAVTATTDLELGTDYTVEYSNNVEVGTATITVTGIGAYTGEIVKTFTIKAKEEPEGLRGDINGDGKLSIEDASMALKIVVYGPEGYTDAQVAAADLNGDGSYTIEDASTALKIFVYGE